jgi:transcriptional regulator with XRE-family HTH domain
LFTHFQEQKVTSHHQEKNCHLRIMTHHYLTISRKRSRLTQSDVSYFLNLKDPSSVSRWEAGEREVPFEALLIYHILFQIPIQDYISKQKKCSKEGITKRIPVLLEELKQLERTPRVQRRIDFLNNTLTRLSSL